MDYGLLRQYTIHQHDLAFPQERRQAYDLAQRSLFPSVPEQGHGPPHDPYERRPSTVFMGTGDDTMEDSQLDPTKESHFDPIQEPEPIEEPLLAASFPPEQYNPEVWDVSQGASDSVVGQRDPTHEPKPIEEPKLGPINEPKPTEEPKLDPINEPKPTEEPKLDPINEPRPTEKGPKPKCLPTKKPTKPTPIEEVDQKPELDPNAQSSEAGQKKRKFLKDMTPNSKEQEMERRREANRAKSKLWHQKWSSKGVPKDAEQDERQDDPATNQVAQAAAVHDDGNAQGDEKPPFQPNQELMNMALDGDMRKVRSKFISQWLEWHASDESQSADAKKKAELAWMESELRAQILAGRKGKIY